MKFEDLPFNVQIIAAETLASRMSQSGFSVTEEKICSASKIAHELRNAFIELYGGDCCEGEKVCGQDH